MSEPKPFASLSSGLLARKGAARPAMRPQGFGQVGNGLEDLGWNDMGGGDPPLAAPAAPVAPDGAPEAFSQQVVEHPRAYHPTGLSPIDSPVHGQQAEIADRFSADGEDEHDEEFDETAELYDPDAPFVTSEDEEDEGGEDENGGERREPAAAFEPAPTPAPFAPKKQMALDALQPVAFEPEVEAVELSTATAFDRLPPPIESAPVTATAQPAPRRAPKPRAQPGQKGKAAFTLRLDPERHLKLRLACAVDGRSAQMLVTAALDRLLAEMPELQEMAAKAKRKG